MDMKPRPSTGRREDVTSAWRSDRPLHENEMEVGYFGFSDLIQKSLNACNFGDWCKSRSLREKERKGKKILEYCRLL